ncbi:MAG: DUF2007 domain-containing protein [Bacteroidales bacterium]|nr:DUF2007 domain-containing protein [Bacteroidales bacterium]
MDNLTTVISFTLPHDAHFAKAKLQSEGVEVFMKDEMTAHVNHLYSGAIGGVKLQVRSADVDTAHRILVESGYIEEHKRNENSLLIKFDKLTSSWPLIKALPVEIRLIITAALIVSVVIVTIVLVALP